MSLGHCQCQNALKRRAVSSRPVLWRATPETRSCQPSAVPRLFAMGCSAGQMTSSTCQRGSLKPRRRLDTPMQRPLLIQALIITRRLGFLE